LRTVKLPDPTRAIYIDFEGNEDTPPTLLGALWPRNDGESVFQQFVFERAFESAALAEIAGLTWERRFSELSNTIEPIVHRAEENDLEIVAWSTHELGVIRASVPTHLSEAFAARFRNAIQVAKKWLRATRPSVHPPKSRRGGRYRLAFFLKLIEYRVPTSHGPLLTGRRLNYLRRELAAKGNEFERLTGTSKRKWTNLLKHNWIDCDGMRAIDERAVRELTDL
jgi:hypothetical protein